MDRGKVLHAYVEIVIQIYFGETTDLGFVFVFMAKTKSIPIFSNPFFTVLYSPVRARYEQWEACPHQSFPSEDVAVETNPVLWEVEASLQEDVSLQGTRVVWKELKVKGQRKTTVL